MYAPIQKVKLSRKCSKQGIISESRALKPEGEDKITNIGMQFLGTQKKTESKSHVCLGFRWSGLASDERGV
jgi:hypothetical protein